ncbi:PREDICTED: uncharacterized protein LOC104819630 [Tarenaya hassleriana]|uniref:uncharacterized protein LOC104819630 n=1 Tax=Tarenaya hassleriana TaxID=28532 RepID=UPI00053C31BC|nr:PREDICTED: uncharacterized protein LOC104819630 [Tarenaya hassleriana]
MLSVRHSGSIMLIPRWRNLLCLEKHSLVPKISASSAMITNHASFHSTCVLSEKWKKQWDSNDKAPKRERPSKNHIRYTVRQKRADAKKALNHLLFHTGRIQNSFQDEWNFDSPKQEKLSKKCKPGRGKKPSDKKTKRWHSQESFSDDYDSDNRFEATFGRRTYSWSFKYGSCSRNSGSSGFEWREGWNWTNQRTKNRDDEYWDESLSVGSRSDRTILGLPLFGPLKIEDVKKAFQEAALKWHPDKNQGPYQDTAQEKFKLCLGAYNSLCSALHQSV